MKRSKKPNKNATYQQQNINSNINNTNITINNNINVTNSMNRQSSNQINQNTRSFQAHNIHYYPILNNIKTHRKIQIM